MLKVAANKKHSGHLKSIIIQPMFTVILGNRYAACNRYIKTRINVNTHCKIQIVQGVIAKWYFYGFPIALIEGVFCVEPVFIFIA